MFWFSLWRSTYEEFLSKTYLSQSGPQWQPVGGTYRRKSVKFSAKCTVFNQATRKINSARSPGRTTSYDQRKPRTSTRRSKITLIMSIQNIRGFSARLSQSAHLRRNIIVPSKRAVSLVRSLNKWLLYSSRNHLRPWPRTRSVFNIVMPSTATSISDQDTRFRNAHLCHRRSGLFLSNKDKTTEQQGRWTSPAYLIETRQQQICGLRRAHHYPAISYQDRRAFEDEWTALNSTPKSPNANRVS